MSRHMATCGCKVDIEITKTICYCGLEDYCYCYDYGDGVKEVEVVELCEYHLSM
jgi:hypothetical protein